MVTRARRPAGWKAPGPPPRTPTDRPEVWPRPGEELCCLCGDWRILQRIDGHRWSLDDLVTAWVAACQPAPRRALDLGCGIGSVLLLLAWRFPRAHFAGVEAQSLSFDLARRSAAWNGVESRCDLHHGDLRDPDLALGGERFDLVTGTPPYLRPGTATRPLRLQQAGCHIELRGGIEDYCRAATRWMTEEGTFVVCEAARQEERVQRAAGAARLAIWSRLDVVPREGKSPLLSVYVLRFGRPCAIEIPSPLVVRDRGGRWTDRFVDLRRSMGMPV